MADTNSPINPFENLTSILGAGGAIYSQQQAYNGLQNALHTIGPTQLQNFGINGPGGMNTGFNLQNGTGSINLGGLNPAFSGFSGAAGAGAAGYNAGTDPYLSGVAGSTLNPALSTLNSAYGNYNQGMGAANQQLGSMGDFNSTYNNMLQAQYGQLQPQIQQQAFGLQNTLFGNGVADSSGAASGSLAAQNFGRGVGQAQSTAQLNAYQQALAQQSAAAQNYGTLSNSANGILNNALGNFGNTTQLISGLNTAGLNNAGTAAQGAAALGTYGLNNYNASLQTPLAAATARNQSLFPYAQVANSLAGTQTGLSGLSSILSKAGAAGGIPGLSSLLGKIPGLSQYFGGGNGGTPGSNNYMGQQYDPSTGSYSNGYTPGGFGQGDYSPYVSSPDVPTPAGGDNGNFNWLGDNGGNFNAAGGEAAGQTAGNPQSTASEALAGYKAIKTGQNAYQAVSPLINGGAAVPAADLASYAAAGSADLAGLGTASGSAALAADPTYAAAMGMMGDGTAGAGAAGAGAAGAGGSSATLGALGTAAAWAAPAAIAGLAFSSAISDWRKPKWQDESQSLFKNATDPNMSAGQRQAVLQMANWLQQGGHGLNPIYDGNAQLQYATPTRVLTPMKKS
jgi:hypothetical protein